MSGRSEIGLSDTGRREAERLADRLVREPISAVHASPRRRAMETARIIADRHHLPVIESAALDEIDFGVWTGRSFASLADDPDWRRWNAERATAAPPGGESMTDAVTRAADHLVTDDAAGPILCVTHCDVIRGIVAKALGLGMDGIFGFDCAPASLTTLDAENGRMRLVTLNERMR